MGAEGDVHDRRQDVQGQGRDPPGVRSRPAPFQPQNHWESDTPAYKVRITVNGDRGTLYFECHYIDVDTQKVAAAVGADQDVRKINGKWLITKAIASSVTLKPWSGGGST